MTETQFIILIATVVVLSVLGILILLVAMERAIRLRWASIEAMFDRALAHGGSLDTLSRAARADSAEAKRIAAGALEATRLLKDALDDSEVRIRALEEHPVLRRFGGNGHTVKP